MYILLSTFQHSQLVYISTYIPVQVYILTKPGVHFNKIRCTATCRGSSPSCSEVTSCSKLACSRCLDNNFEDGGGDDDHNEGNVAPNSLAVGAFDDGFEDDSGDVDDYDD